MTIGRDGADSAALGLHFEDRSFLFVYRLSSCLPMLTSTVKTDWMVSHRWIRSWFRGETGFLKRTYSPRSNSGRLLCICTRTHKCIPLDVLFWSWAQYLWQCPGWRRGNRALTVVGGASWVSPDPFSTHKSGVWWKPEPGEVEGNHSFHQSWMSFLQALRQVSPYFPHFPGLASLIAEIVATFHAM